MDTACYVKYNGKIILIGHKDPNTDLWVLPVTPHAIARQEKMQTSQGNDSVNQAWDGLISAAPSQSWASPCMARAPQAPWYGR